MADILPQTKPGRFENTTVVLLFPELFTTGPDHAALLASLLQPHTPVRLLIRLATPSLALAEAVAQAGIAVELLLPVGMILPTTTLPLARMPPGSTKSDTDELALALADVLLAGPDDADEWLVSHARELKRHAKELEKPLLTPGAELRNLATAQRCITHRLDPGHRGWHRWLRRFWGRTEQFWLELAAFNWRGFSQCGASKSRGRLRECALVWNWPLDPYFATKGWQNLAPDRAALDPACPIVHGFDRLDRSAVHGAFIHRDLAWAVHAAAAFAVFFAVAGYIELFGAETGLVWPASEFVALSFILLATIAIRQVDLQDRWTACRFGAEQLRIARTCLPLLVVPSALCSVDKPGGDYSERALAEVKRAVRNQGLPRLSPILSPIDAAKWLDCIVADQCNYHRNNHSRLHCAEQRLTRLTEVLFFLAFIAVFLHLVPSLHHLIEEHKRYLLILAAALPAFAAAVHGVTTRLGLVHRIQLSEEAEKELRVISRDLHALITGGSVAETAWVAVRKIAFRASEAMGRETTSWHSQVRRQKDDLA